MASLGHNELKCLKSPASQMFCSTSSPGWQQRNQSSNNAEHFSCHDLFMAGLCLGLKSLSEISCFTKVVENILSAVSFHFQFYSLLWASNKLANWYMSSTDNKYYTTAHKLSTRLVWFMFCSREIFHYLGMFYSKPKAQLWEIHLYAGTMKSRLYLKTSSLEMYQNRKF